MANDLIPTSRERCKQCLAFIHTKMELLVEGKTMWIKVRHDTGSLYCMGLRDGRRAQLIEQGKK